MTVLRRLGGWLLLIPLLISLLGGYRVVSAQDRTFSLITSPLPISLSTKPGVPVSTELRVKNNSSDTERLKVSLFKFDVTETSEVRILEKQPGDDFLEWASFSPSVFQAPPGEWTAVKMTIDVPKTAGLGYYYAVGFSRADAPKPAPGDTALEGQVITFVLLDVSVPGAKRELQVTELSADRSFYEFLPTTMTVKVKNTGNIHLAPTGNIFISRGSKTVATLSINPNQGNILPDSVRTFKAEWNDGFPVYTPKQADGKAVNNPDGTPAKELKWDFSKAPSLRAGKYTAHMVLVYDDGQRDIPIEAKLSFWVVPWRLIAGVILIPVIPALLVYLLMKRRFKKNQRPSNEN